MAIRGALGPIAAILVVYLLVPIGLWVLSGLEGENWKIANHLYYGEFLLSWSFLAMVALAVSMTSLLYGWKRLRWWLRTVVIVLYLPVVGVVPFAVGYGIQGLQDYAAAYAAYEGAEQACGRPPIVATDKESWGGGFYLRPGDPDYARQKYSSHIHLLLGSNTIFFCSEADAIAHGYRPESTP